MAAFHDGLRERRARRRDARDRIQDRLDARKHVAAFVGEAIELVTPALFSGTYEPLAKRNAGRAEH
jgi:hypothetical protein